LVTLRRIVVMILSRAGLASTALIALAALAVVPGKPSAGERALYTKAQAVTGAKYFAANCAACHGAHLQGISGPALKGLGSLPGQSVAQAYSYCATQMPQDKPGSLTPAQYAAIVAFILKERGHPAGATPLTPAVATKSDVTI
jgi:mono/diheme cytochrome c family protein